MFAVAMVRLPDAATADAGTAVRTDRDIHVTAGCILEYRPARIAPFITIDLLGIA